MAHTGTVRKRTVKGTGTIGANGYRAITVNGRRTYEHILVAEKALGRRLPKGAQVHHINEIRTDNRPENLVICPGYAYHALLHLRQDALDAGKPAHYRRCTFCREHDDPENLAFVASGRGNVSDKIYHLACRAAYRRKARSFRS